MDGAMEVSRPAQTLTPIGVVLGGVPAERARPFLEELVSLGLISDKGTIPYATKSGSKMQRDDLVKRVVMFLYEFRRHPKNPSDLYYKRWDGDVFQAFDKDDPVIKDIVNKTYTALFTVTPQSEVSSTIQNIANNICELAQLDSGVIKLGPKMYWLSREGYIADSLPNGTECYYQLFNSPKGGQFPRVEFTEEESRGIYDRYMKVWNDWLLPHVQSGEEFGAFMKDLPIEYDFMKIWADPSKPGFRDRYWDLLLAIVPNFLYKKPPVAYFLLGNARGGKSSYVKMLHMMFGSSNTSTVRLNELGDPHLNLRLASTLLNAPDEEMEASLSAKDMANFKSLAAHEQLELPVLYRTRPQSLTPNFMMYLPSNALPQFTGSGAEACMRRARVMMFTADLSRLDRIPKDFLKETFTHELLVNLLGTVLALAKYFTENEFWYSKTMINANDYVSQSVNSAQLYYKEWSKFFDGFDKLSTIWEDYANWCKLNDYTMEKMGSVKQRFFNELQNRKSYRNSDGIVVKAYRVPGGKNVMTQDFLVERYDRTIKEILAGGNSAVEMLSALAEADLESSVMKQIQPLVKFAMDEEKRNGDS